MIDDNSSSKSDDCAMIGLETGLNDEVMQMITTTTRVMVTVLQTVQPELPVTPAPIAPATRWYWAHCLCASFMRNPTMAAGRTG